MNSSLGYQFGGSLTGSVTTKANVSAGFLHQNFMQHQYGNLSSVAFDASTKTGFGDQVWYEEQTDNIYVYPVIGKSDCPIANPDCSEAEKQPAHMIFSLTLPMVSASANGAGLEWYQPVHEPGNLFSYPWSLTLLESEEGNPTTGTTIELLTPGTPRGFFTDSSSLTETSNWSQQNNNSVTSGSTNKFSWGAGFSLTAKAGQVGGVVGGTKWSYNGSVAFSTLTTTVSQLGESQGIGITKPGTFPNPDLYQYPIWPYVFGDTLPLGEAGTGDRLKPGTQVSTSGLLRAEFVADPTNTAAGPWWRSVYTAPDIAVAHPARWYLIDSRSQSGDSCIRISATSSTKDCASFNLPQTDIWTSEFYWMKGLFITPADANGNLTGAGPQIEEVTAGDKVLLQARIYNDSIADIPSGDVVVVQFYGEPWDSKTLQPLNPEKAFLIEEVDTAPLPGFNSPNYPKNTPNWAVVGTSKLNTSLYSDEDLAFWIVAYVKDGRGNLVSEMPGHGLIVLPPVFKSITDVATYLEGYSNNVGFYKQTLHILPPDSPPTVDPSQAGISVSNLTVSPSRIELGQAAIISGQVHTVGEIDGISIAFNDGVRGRSATSFDVDQIPHIRANDYFLSKTVYHANSCGKHALSVSPLDVPMNSRTIPTAQVAVFMDPLVGTQELITATTNARLPNGTQNSLLAKLQAAQQSFREGNQTAGQRQLIAYGNEVMALRGKNIPNATADALMSLLSQVQQCIAS